MKSIFLFMFLSVTALYSQVVKTDPFFATEDDSIRVIFNAALGNEGLMGYYEDVYVHAGLITSKSSSSSDWKYVPGKWGENLPKTKMKRLSADLYQLVIGKPRAFFEVPDTSTEKLLQMAFVFRSHDNSRTGRGDGGADIVVDFSEPGVDVAIVDPHQKFQFVTLNQEIEILAISKQAKTISLFLNDTEVSKVENDSIAYTMTVTEKDRTWIIAVAEDAQGNKKADSVYVISKSSTETAELPANIEYGINYIDDNTVTLALYAPYKEDVFVVGDFSNWYIDPAYQMKRTSDGTTYWVTISGLIPKQEYGFQYLVDSELLIPDLYADKILDPWNDKHIKDETYPDLKKYPDNKTNNIVSVLQTAQDEYQWNIAKFNRPENKDLVIYELLVRDFVENHHYNSIIDSLDYLKTLGVNAIELMPVSEFEGNESWGYNPMMYFAPDKYYGTKTDLKSFIDAAHEKGIAVIMDIVLNHAYGNNPMVRLYFDAQNNRPTAQSPWFNEESPNQAFSWGYDFDHESKLTQDFVDRVTNYWISEYKFDGFRFDFTKGFTNTPGDGWGRDESRIAILKRMGDAIWKNDSTAYLILEHLTDNTEERELANYGFMLWGNLNGKYSEAAMGYNNDGKSNFSWGSYKSRYWNDPHLIAYMESHDEERLMVKTLTYGNSSGSYDTKIMNYALGRIKLASAFYYSIPGPKMIWQFGELGYDYSINYNGRTGNKPIKWDYYQEPERRRLYKFISEMLKLRNQYGVFDTEDFVLTVNEATKKINLNSPAMNVTIVGNFDVISGKVNPEFQHNGKWYDYFGADSIDVTNVNGEITLEPGEFRVYLDKKINFPSEDLVTGISSDKDETPDSYVLAQNYPNPFNPETTIEFSIPKGGLISLKVYNLIGEEIATIVNKDLSPGNYRFKWDGKNSVGEKISSGIYFYRLKGANFLQTKKMLLLK